MRLASVEPCKCTCRHRRSIRIPPGRVLMDRHLCSRWRPASDCRHGSEGPQSRLRPVQGDPRGRPARGKANQTMDTCAWGAFAHSRRPAFCEGHQGLPIIRLAAWAGWTRQSVYMVARRTCCKHVCCVHGWMHTVVMSQTCIGTGSPHVVHYESCSMTRQKHCELDGLVFAAAGM